MRIHVKEISKILKVYLKIIGTNAQEASMGPTLEKLSFLKFSAIFSHCLEDVLVLKYS